MNKAEKKSKVGPWVVFLPILLIIAATIVGQYFSEEEEETKDHEAAEKLLDYIGAEKLVQHDFLYNYVNFRVYNDTLVGIRFEDNHFFVQSLNDTSYSKTFVTDKETAPSYLYSEPDRLSPSRAMNHFQYFKNKCLYFGNYKKPIDKVCVDGQHYSVLTEEALEKREGSFHHGHRGGFIYHDGMIFQGTSKGIYGFDEDTGELILSRKHRGEDVGGGMQIVGEMLIFYDIHKYDEKVNFIGINHNNLNKVWERTFEFNDGMRMYGMRTDNNSKDVCILRLRTPKRAYFIEASTGDIISKVNYSPFHPSPGLNIIKYSNSFITTKDSTSLVRTEKGTGKLDFRKNEMLWETSGTLFFPYKGYLVLREMVPQIIDDGVEKGVEPEKFYVLDRQTGELLKTIPVEGNQHPRFEFHNGGYIQMGTTIYK